MIPRNKKIIIGGTVIMILIGLYLWFAVKKANTAAATSTAAAGTSSGSVPAGTGAAASSGSTPAATSTTTPVPTSGATSSWLNWLLGIGSSPAQTAYTSADNSSAFPLKNGSSGEEVKNLQIWLNNHVIVPYSLLNVDGKFGSLTLAALKRTLGVSSITEDWYKVNILNPNV